MTIRDRFKKFSERFHGELHLSLGLLVAVVIYYLLGGNLFHLLLVSAVASFLPDIDHLFYLFIYGRKSRYATEAREILIKGGVIKYIEYCKINHKENTEIKSHNLLVVLVLTLVSMLFYAKGEPLWSAFFISNTLHFVFDVFEDLLFFGKLNGNWWLRFGQGR